ncbi:MULTISPECIES: hypothetical protein [Peribacillus]|nr:MULTISPECIES: hypothetical protein [unclassified Peribacillus]
MRKIIVAFDRELVIAERNSAGWNVECVFKFFPHCLDHKLM